MLPEDVMLVVKKGDLDIIKSEIATLKALIINKKEQEKKIMNIRQLMEYLNKSRTSIFRYMNHYEMPYHRLGPDPVFYPEEIDAWIRNSRIKVK